jgi:hypothetical protein
LNVNDSIKRDVKKKVLPRPESECVALISSPLCMGVPPRFAQGFCSGRFALLVAFSAGGDNGNRV